MKKLILLILCILPGIGFAAPFTPQNIVVVRIGDGVSALSSASFAVFLDEYTVAGTLVQTIALPTSVSAPNYRLVLSGSGTSEGFLNLSADGSFLTLAGYDANVGTTAIAGTSTTGGTPVLRVFGLIDATGTVNSATGVEAFSAGNPRSLVTVDGTAFWGAGSNSGVRYMVAGGLPNSSVQLSTTPTNNRVVNIFNGQLYITSASGTFQGIATVGTNVPTTTGQTTTILPGFPTTAGPSPYGYSISPAGDVAYVADDRATASGGGVQKWTFSAGTWTLAYTLNTNLTSGCRGLTVNWLTPTPTIYATTAVASNNGIVTTIDLGSNVTSPFVTIVTGPGTNRVFRGIAFTPGSITPVEMSSFTSSVNLSNVKLSWTTVNEQNNSGFNIERKSNNSEWVTVGNVAGNGISTVSNSYSFEDRNLSTGNYSYRLKQIDYNGNFEYFNLSNEVIIGVPARFELSQNYPNPFNPSTQISYELAKDNLVSLKIYDMSGKEVSNLVNTVQSAGYYTVTFNASKLSSGIYFYTLKTNDFISTKKMMLVK